MVARRGVGPTSNGVVGPAAVRGPPVMRVKTLIAAALARTAQTKDAAEAPNFDRALSTGPVQDPRPSYR